MAVRRTFRGADVLRCVAFTVVAVAGLSARIPGQSPVIASDTARRSRAPDSLGAVRRHYTKQNSIAFATLGVVSFGVIWILPENISKWPREERKLNHLLAAYQSGPVWDHDPWVWNYVIHPVAGAYAYDAERNHDESPLRSFLFSTGASVAWEYGFEAWIEHPSRQDLLITSTTGSLLGELSYRATRHMAKNGFNPFEKIAVLIINPVWVLQKGFRP